MFRIKGKINGHGKYHVRKTAASLSESYISVLFLLKESSDRKETCIIEVHVICDSLLPRIILSCFNIGNTSAA